MIYVKEEMKVVQGSGFQTIFGRGPVGGPYDEKKVLSGLTPIELNVKIFLLGDQKWAVKASLKTSGIGRTFHRRVPDLLFLQHQPNF